MDVIKLGIYQVGSETAVRAVANKWKFQDSMMGEQFITLNITSEVPIEWAVGDWCEFRGEVFTLNYIPTVTQKARSGEIGNAYTYENIKFDSRQEELTRCVMLDITPTTGYYVAALGTNYTGSSRFQLFCGETSVVVSGHTETLTPVCALAAKIQANLDRVFPDFGWRILVDTETTYTTSSGKTELVTHTDDKLLSFDNTTVAAALAMVQTEFDLDFCVKGRTVYIGYTLDSLTSDNGADVFAFGYGHGYPTKENPGTGLFQIKQISNSQQKIVTRLRALGSTKNLPYRYYNKKYQLPQSLFPTNLQLPGTFLPEGQPSDTASATGSTKWAQNNARSENLADVLGDTNDAYIDKNGDAASCPDGIREDCARWDGSNGDLPEIYPTIEGVTFGELRNGGVEDMDGTSGGSAFQGTTVHPNDERIDNLLAVGYTDNGTLIDDANIGDGINPEENTLNVLAFPAVIAQSKLSYSQLDDSGLAVYGDEAELFTVKNVAPGHYFMAPTGPSYSSVVFGFKLSFGSSKVGYIIKVKQVVGASSTVIAQYQSDFTTVSDTAIHEVSLPELPDLSNTQNGQVSSITVTEQCNIVVTFMPVLTDMSGNDFILSYQVGRSRNNPNDDYDPEYNWGNADSVAAVNGSFHVFIKDMGFDLTATFNGDTPVMAMKSGRCVGREFEIGENVVKGTVNGVKGYILTLKRAQDSNLNTYYPSSVDTISAGDYFVLLGISMPDAYISAAEARLLAAATDYLADNCETKYTYQPSIDDIYLQRQYDNLKAQGRKQESVFWRLYAGLRFLFRGIPVNDSNPPLIDITIEQVTITMGEGLTPKVEIVLNDDIQQSTIQKLTTAVDRIYNGSAYSSGGGASAGALYEILLTEGGRMFLSRLKDDVANGKITFNDIVTAVNLIKAKSGIQYGDFMPGWLGSGANIDSDGNGEFDSLHVRGAIRAAELVFNRVSAEEGEAIRSIGHGEILTVTPSSPTSAIGEATLKLDGDEWATIEVGDICRGMYNTVNMEYDNRNSEGVDANGFRLKAGFYSSYFKVLAITSSGKGYCSFSYFLQANNGVPTCEHPCPLMKFAVYGNANNNKKERQSSMYISAVGQSPKLLFLTGVNTFKIKPENIKIALGNIEGIKVWEEITESEYQETSGVDGVDKYWSSETVDNQPVYHYYRLKELKGDAGFYCEDNIYLGGIIDQFKSAAMDAINSQLSNLGQAWVLASADTFIVDCNYTGEILSTQYLDLDSWLHYGGAECELDNGNLVCHYEYDGRVLSVTLSDNNHKASRRFTFTAGNTLSSGTITIFLKGTYNGTAYTASKSVTIIANKQGAPGTDGTPGLPGTDGNDGDDGRGISSVVTYYKATAESDNVTASTAANPVNDGWSESFVEPTESLPYLWRFTRYYFTSGTEYENTPCERVGSYQVEANPNLLEDSEFKSSNQMTAWTSGKVINDDIADPSSEDFDDDTYAGNQFNITSGKDGHNAFMGVFKGSAATNAFVILLEQNLFNPGVMQKIEGGRWYTLSFWVKGSSNSYFNVSCNAIDTNASIYINGEQKTGATDYTFRYSRGHYNATDWTKVTFTFKTVTTLASIRYYVQWSMFDTTSQHTIRICMPKLEIGQFATRYEAVPVIDDYTVRTSEWGLDVDYMHGGIGEYYLDLVMYEGTWFQCIRSHRSDASNSPTSLLRDYFWRQANKFNFIATDLILAESAVLNFLHSQRIFMTGVGGELTASMNADGKGSYCIYYLNRRKRMELSSDGYLYYYYDNEANSVAWRLGYGGSIETSIMDTVDTISLHKFDIAVQPLPPIASFNRPTEELDFDQIGSAMATFKQVKASPNGNWGSYNGMIYKVWSNNPASSTVADDGYYTPNQYPYQTITPSGVLPKAHVDPPEKNVFGYTVYELSGGKIVWTFEVRSDDEAFS